MSPPIIEQATLERMAQYVQLQGQVHLIVTRPDGSTIEVIIGDLERQASE